MVKRVLGIATAVALLGIVAYALIPDDPNPNPTTNTTANKVTITGLIGSEKRAFFEDQSVKDELAKQGLVVNADSTGSWTMADQASASPEKLDFAFPASGEPADAVKRAWKLQDSPVVPFYSPVVILTHQAAADVLKNGGLAEKDDATQVWKFKMDEYVKALDQGKRWESMKGAENNPDLRGQVLVTTTDPETSSSGAMFLALLSWAANDHQVVSDDAAVTKVAKVMNAAVGPQGSLKSSTDEVFRNFTANVGRPLVFGYESQVAQLQLQGAPLNDTVVLYPDTTVHSDHTLVGRTEAGRKLASLLRDDDVLVSLEARYGFRPQKRPEVFGQETKGRQPQLAPDLKSANVGQAPVPSLEFLRKLTNVAKGGPK
ncbi:substrate-binding domain-containing protein [Streptomyces sp. NRRL WC-3742]|uniref:substrate-binding domain-containing protein n=1 Tax=Streptomyces sp. NRRL WC-3742 TaxID=1463934 RepID=UPI0004C4E6A8|nr:substrate-binding domain-containing protein [Streptomyces sp. NRRL WC-3742]